MNRQLASCDESFHPFRMRAMNTNIELIYGTKEIEAPHIERFAADWFRKTEARFSRFHSDSELSQINKLTGKRCLLSEAMLEILLLTKAYRKSTNGVFEPFIKEALEHAGYNQSFEQLKLQMQSTLWEAPVPQRNQEMIIDPLMKSAILPAQLDLGGIVKSWAVRRLSNYLQKKLMVKQGLINAGGDLVVWGGSSEQLDPWLIGIENPWEEEVDIGILALHDGAAATSSKLGRQWTTDGGRQHHLIDPRTMRPSQSDIVQCTVTGPNLMDCEIWAKTICILGLEAGLTLFSRKTVHYEALLFTSDRQVHYYGSQSSFGSKWRELRIDQFHKTL
jgi:FAD:protein FMN transferase